MFLGYDISSAEDIGAVVQAISGGGDRVVRNGSVTPMARAGVSTDEEVNAQYVQDILK